MESECYAFSDIGVNCFTETLAACQSELSIVAAFLCCVRVLQVEKSSLQILHDAINVSNADFQVGFCHGTLAYRHCLLVFDASDALLITRHRAVSGTVPLAVSLKC